jgi:outer membrane protein assembly factor BamA
MRENKIRLEKFILCVIILLFQIPGNGQNTDSIKGPCEVKDATDYIKQWLHIKKKNTQKNTAIFAAPVLGSTPSTGFIYGLTLQGTFKLPKSNISAFQSNIQFTSKQQFSVSLKNNVFAKNNKIFLSGDWSYFNYSQPTYGLGTDAPNGKVPEYFYFNQGAPDDSLVQPMKYTYIKLHQTFSFRAAPNLFVGPGIHIDLYSQIDDIKLDTNRLTSHYLYSKKYGFDPKKYDVIGMSLNMVYDSRDNPVNAYKGIYANLNYRYNPEFLGSDQASSTLWSEFRAYVGVSKKKPQELFAFWFVSHFTVSGTLPYLNLPALGNDQRNKTGRGYTIARFRGNNMLYAETEFRFPISKCTHTLSGVVFANAVTTDDKDRHVRLFEYIKPGFGAGLRILFQKKSRMNILVDYAKGENSGGIYFSAFEVF